MTTLPEHIIVAGAENRPPMLEKSMYDSWASYIRLIFKRKKHGRMMFDSIDNGPLTRPMKYSELTKAQQLQDDCDVQATNIILHIIPPDVYALVNHQEAGKDIWDRVKLLMKGTELSYQERECILYNLFDKFAYVQGETLYLDPLALVANSPTLYNLSQSPQHSGSSMYPPPQQFTLVYASPIHHQYHHTPVNPQQHSASLEPFISPPVTQHSQADFPLLDSGFAVLTFQQGEYPIECINKAMHSYLLWYQGFHLQTINSERLPIPGIMQPFKMAESQFNKFKEENLRDLLALETEELPQLQEEIMQLTEDLDAYDSDCDDLSSAIAILMANLLSCDSDVLFETEDFDAYDSDCDDLSSAIAILMANLLSCDSDVLFEVPYSDSSLNDIINRDVNKKIAVIQDSNSSAPNDLLVLSLVEQMTGHVAHLDKEN
nr:hypothetical protein [Tanacetum cinerariifolium]